MFRNKLKRRSSVFYRENELPPITDTRSEFGGDDGAPDDPVAGEGGDRSRDRLPLYVESMWNSITTSSQAVTSAVQNHIVSKIPMLGKCIHMKATEVDSYMLMMKAKLSCPISISLIAGSCSQPLSHKNHQFYYH